MEYNVLLAGVGGQGILTIAHAISRSALRRGYHVKQSEVHGMSQRGGAVQAHLRFADHTLYSDLIPVGQADMLLTVEPLETLRYAEYLNEKSVIIANSVPFVNIANYPPVEEVLARLVAMSDHVLLDARRLARAAGSARAENMVMLGAASAFLIFELNELEQVVAEAFAAKGERVVDVNRRAIRLGRKAAVLFRDALRRGAASHTVRQWMETLAADEFDQVEAPDPAAIGLASATCELTGAEGEAVSQILERARQSGRRQLLEHEIYSIIELSGAIAPPRHRLIPAGNHVSAQELQEFPGDRVVLKIVSPDVVHKTEAGGLCFVPKSEDRVNQKIQQLIQQHDGDGRRIEGVLIVECVEQAGGGFGAELFVGIRATEEFGPVIAAGLGGVDTEYLATKMLPRIAVAKAAALHTTPERFFETFRATAAYEILAGRVRGRQRVVGDGELIRCFRAFLAIARTFCTKREDDLCLEELEVNPFAFVHQRMVPLDGRGRLGTLVSPPAQRPADKIASLLEPRSIAVMGVSTKRANFGRIILDNIKNCGFPSERLYVLKEDVKEIDGVRCVPSLAALPESVDLLVAAIGGEQIPDLVERIVEQGRTGPAPCESVILIPGGLGERKGTEETQQRIQQAIAASRARPDGGPVFLGGNCMGVRSRIGRYDTFFVPPEKLDPRRRVPPKHAALISQSGAFIITRMSNLEFLDPSFCVSVGNQIDLTISDMFRAIAQRGDVDTIGVYVEGFRTLDGLPFLRAVEEAAEAGKVVVFYKAGKTQAGISAAMGHTASVAGDYDVCQAAVADAGAIVTDTFKEFEQIVELATQLHGKPVGGTALGAISNAGYEAVGMADTLRGTRFQVHMPALSEDTRQKLADVLAAHRLDRLVEPKNPLDLTPMANDECYEACARIFLEAPEIDALIVGCVPLTPALLTLPEECSRPGSLAHRMAGLFAQSRKPLIFVVDCAGIYETFARQVRQAGVPVFRSADQAVRSLGRYLNHRVRSKPTPKTAAESEHAGPAAFQASDRRAVGII